MSDINGTEVNVGDKVRIKHAWGYEIIGPVHEVRAGHIYIGKSGSECGGWSLDKVESIEVLERAIPTKPGVYLPYPATSNGRTPNVWLLLPNGTWIDLPNIKGATTRPLSEVTVRKYLKSLVYLGDGRDDEDEFEDEDGLFEQ